MVPATLIAPTKGESGRLKTIDLLTHPTQAAKTAFSPSGVRAGYSQDAQ
jgi:hypothetical protein